jgi:hypothetical protein
VEESLFSSLQLNLEQEKGSSPLLMVRPELAGKAQIVQCEQLLRQMCPQLNMVQVSFPEWRKNTYPKTSSGTSQRPMEKQ